MKNQNGFLANLFSEKKKSVTWAIVVAAGSSSRMGSTAPASKQLIPLEGRTVIERTLDVFSACEGIEKIIVGARADEIQKIKEIVLKNGYPKVHDVVAGGTTRQKSVAACMAVLPSGVDYIAIHDGARCLVTVGQIEAVLADAYKYGAAAAAVRVKDTIKKADDDGFIAATVSREKLWAVQTPQIFMTGLYRSALALAEKDGYDMTDDCALAEKAGFKVRLTESGAENLKLTTPEDIDIARGIIRARATNE